MAPVTTRVVELPEQVPANTGFVPAEGVPLHGTAITKLSIPISVKLEAFPTPRIITTVLAAEEGNTWLKLVQVAPVVKLLAKVVKV